MKKLLFIFALLFTVMCYAVPPPDNSQNFLTENIELMQSREDITIQSFELQNYTFVYVLNESFKYVAVTTKIHPKNHFFINKLHGWQANRQNTNFGYPFGSNY